MGVSTIRPTSVVQTGSASVVGPDAITALTDSTDPTGASGDATYVNLPNAARDRNTGMVVTCANPSIPAGAKIVGVAVRMRAKSSPYGRARAQPSVKAGATTSYNQTAGVISDYGNQSIVYYIGGYDAADPYGAEWVLSTVNGLQILLTNKGSGTVSIYDLWVDVLYNEVPTVTITSPAATIATTTPEIDWQYSDADGDPPASYWLKVFSDAQHAVAGFNPATSPSLVDTGWYPSSANPAAYVLPSTVALQNGQTYWVYVKARQQWYGFGVNESAWAIASTTVSIVPPPTPSVTAVADVPNGRINATVTPGVGSVPQNQVVNPDAETSAANWTPAAATIARVTSPVHSGTGAFALTTTSTGPGYIGATGQQMPVRPGGWVHHETWFRAATTPRTAYVQLDWYDANGGYLSSSYGPGITTSTSAWTLASLDAQAPPGAVAVAPGVVILATVMGGVHYFDDVSAWPYDTFDLQHSDDGGVTWMPMRFGTGVNSVGLAATVSSYEAIPGTPRIYRAQAVRLASGNALRSAWSAPSAAVTLNLRRWRLHYPQDPSKNIQLRWAAEEVEQETEELAEINYALGRPNAIVISSVIRGASLSLPLSFVSDAEFAAFKSIRAVQDVLYLLSPQGWGMYLKLVGKVKDKSDLTAGAETPPNWHEVVVDAVQQDRP